ncbi:hypothetical protein LZ30DRAFT_181294 [Colletotrichum cereale]|nr:hypothetical protein LZ30DRAFT_181294 [Colletotrichum cereale]
MSDSSDSSDSDNDSWTSTLVGGNAGGGDADGNALFTNLLLTGQNKGSLVAHKQKRRKAEGRCARHVTQDSPAGPSAANPPDFYLIDAEGGSRGYRLVAAGVEVRGLSTPSREERDGSDEVAPMWANILFLCILITVSVFILVSKTDHHIRYIT